MFMAEVRKEQARILPVAGQKNWMVLICVAG